MGDSDLTTSSAELFSAVSSIAITPVLYKNLAQRPDEMREYTFILIVLGGGVALVISLIGILNFINVMSKGIMVRKNELTILESIGKERKKIRQMLRLEGLGYAIIALLLTSTLGSAVAYGIFILFKLQALYAVFSYPFIPMSIVVFIILVICIVTPNIAYNSISKITIVEQLKEVE